MSAPTPRHPLSAAEVERLNEALAADNVPVTVQVPAPGRVVLWPALALTSRQEAHTLRLVMDETDATVRWAGAVA